MNMTDKIDDNARRIAEQDSINVRLDARIKRLEESQSNKKPWWQSRTMVASLANGLVKVAATAGLLNGVDPTLISAVIGISLGADGMTAVGRANANGGIK